MWKQSADGCPRAAVTYGLTLPDTLLFELWWNSSNLTPLSPALNSQLGDFYYQLWQHFKGLPPKVALLMKTFLEISILTDCVFNKFPVAFPQFGVNTYNTQLPTFGCRWFKKNQNLYHSGSLRSAWASHCLRSTQGGEISWTSQDMDWLINYLPQLTNIICARHFYRHWRGRGRQDWKGPCLSGVKF